MTTRELFLLTRSIRQTRDGLELTYWGRAKEGPVCLRFGGQEARFFVERSAVTEAGTREPTELRTLGGAPVDALRFPDLRGMRAEADRLALRGTPGWEVDVKPVDRFLMERLITAGCVATGEVIVRPGFEEMIDPALAPAEVAPALRVASFDVESEGADGPLLCVAIVEGDLEHVFVRGAGPERAGVRYFEDERATLEAFLAHVRERDPDLLIGWNVIEFDVDYLEKRCREHGIPFRLGRGRETARVLAGQRPNAPSVALVPGRVVLDGIATMRAATWSFERWSLEHVSQKLLGRGKTIDAKVDDKLQEILRLYREDLPKLIEYNLEDCRLVRDVFTKARVLEFAIERQRLTGLTMDRRAGAVSAFDYLYLPRLHRHGRVAPTTTHRADALASPGGFVMGSDPGLFENVLVLDFKSLYPSLIRTFLVDPLGLAVAGVDGSTDAVPGFEGARFSRTEHILPGLIESLWDARAEAKRIGDEALSRAIKIQMNSFYGVLGTPACRFFDPRLASSITRRGHEVLRTTRRWIEERGHRVIYGDTDSLFVHLGAEHGDADACLALGAAMVEDLNARWRDDVRARFDLDSALELELETVYERFLMPTMRGSDVGSKKRYAGVAKGKLVIKGLEAIRT
ncbi:MAG: DNA polymerase II, partial [Myxococcales bacterium]|nr:DNA polymerase II [Myxococcales bacterium]